MAAAAQHLPHTPFVRWLHALLLPAGHRHLMCIALLLSTQQTDAPLLPQAAIPWQAPEAPRRCLLHPCSAVPFLTHCLFLFGGTSAALSVV